MTKESVLQQIRDFARYIKVKYDVEDCQEYESEQEDNILWLGYQLQKSGQTVIIKMPYVQKENEEIVMKQSSWTVQLGDKSAGGFPTLRQVFFQLQIREYF